MHTSQVWCLQNPRFKSDNHNCFFVIPCSYFFFACFSSSLESIRGFQRVMWIHYFFWIENCVKCFFTCWFVALLFLLLHCKICMSNWSEWAYGVFVHVRVRSRVPVRVQLAANFCIIIVKRYRGSSFFFRLKESRWKLTASSVCLTVTTWAISAIFGAYNFYMWFVN